ncbi:protein of unknown function [Duganella sp. CF517]|uniref:DUF4124 domain-containing protein n=1 Tax=Duganella sp. CF517 TaxID=1881038 RepID=UPI0008AEA5E7|nr:DUF4124 domain-containing protein [Duganella sp. CF517]SEN89524.1 protein of unknown function [Duganella sp. CF517]
MNHHLRAPCAAVLCAAALAANHAVAQSVYKCTVDGKISYSDLPCPAGAAASSTLAVPKAPAGAEGASADLQRMQKESAALQTSRQKVEQREAREAERAAVAAAARRKRCAKLALTKQWADEDARSATNANADKARLRAKRAGESFSLECGH